MDAREAGELGLAELVVPAADLDGAVDDLVAGLLTADADAARATKELLTQAQGHTLDQQAAAERSSQAALQRARLRR
jgi:enoyl-CoA hydratase/carnithine racemase